MTGQRAITVRPGRLHSADPGVLWEQLGWRTRVAKNIAADIERGVPYSRKARFTGRTIREGGLAWAASTPTIHRRARADRVVLVRLPRRRDQYRLMSPPDDFDQCRYEATANKHRDDQRPAPPATPSSGPERRQPDQHEEKARPRPSVARSLPWATPPRELARRRQQMQKSPRAGCPSDAPESTRTAEVHAQR